jgi:hypothetical protein
MLFSQFHQHPNSTDFKFFQSISKYFKAKNDLGTPEAHLVIGHFERGHPNTFILDGDAGEEEFAYPPMGWIRTLQPAENPV